MERNQSRVYFTPYAPVVQTPVPGAMANAMSCREKQPENGVNSRVYETATFSLESKAASAACMRRPSYTARVFASDRFKDDNSNTIAPSLALLEIDSDAGHFRTLIYHARCARQLGSCAIDARDRL